MICEHAGADNGGVKGTSRQTVINVARIALGRCGAFGIAKRDQHRLGAGSHAGVGRTARPRIAKSLCGLLAEISAFCAQRHDLVT
jgi:hypothetical protein